jgi:hypothetical protein
MVFVRYTGDQVSQQSVGIPMGTNCAPLSVELFSVWSVFELMRITDIFSTASSEVSFSQRKIDSLLTQPVLC